MNSVLPIGATGSKVTGKPGGRAGDERPSLGRVAARGALVTMGGQATRLLLQLAGIIVLARLLSPQDYGVVVMVTAIVGIGELLRDLGLSTAAIQASSFTTKQRDNLFWINTAIGTLLAAAVYLAAGALAGFYGDPRLEAVAQALSLTFLFNGLAAQYRAHLTRELRLGRLGAVTIAAQVLGLATGVFLAYGGFGYWALVAQQVVLSAATLVLLAAASGWLPGAVHRKAGTRPLLRFGWNLLGINLITYVGRNAPSVLIGNRFGADLLGLYDRAFQLLMIPLTQINAPATTVALPVLSRLQGDREKFASFLLRGQTVLVHLTVATYSFACAQAQPLVLLVLGSQWQETIPLFQILAVAGVFQGASYATAWVFLAKGLMGSNLRFSLVSRSFLLAAIFFGMQWGVHGVAAAYSLGIAAIWPVGLWWIGRASHAPARAMFGNGARAIVGYACCGAASYASAHVLEDPSPLISIAAGAGGMLIAFALLCIAWPAFRRDVLAIASTRTLLRSDTSTLRGK